MRIGVLSPVAHGTGASCISMLIALRLGYGSTDKVCLTHTHPSDSTLRDMGGIARASEMDKTTSTSMMIQTFQYGGIMTEEEYSQYCNAVSKEVDLFTNVRDGEEMCSFEDAKYLSNYVMEKFPHKYVVVDADDHSEGAVLDVINRCDVIVFVTRLAPRDIERLKSKLAEYKKKGTLAGKRVMLVFNSYQSEIATQKDLAKIIGVPPKSVYFMPMNPHIAWATYARAFPKLWNFVTKGDTRVLSVKQELDRIIQGMTQKQKGGALSKKEIKLFGVKHSSVQNGAELLAPNPVDATPEARKYAEELQKLNYTYVPPTCDKQSELPAGFGGPAQGTGFGQPMGFGQPTTQVVAQPTNQPQAVNFGQPQVVNFGQPQGVAQQVSNSNLLWEDDEELEKPTIAPKPKKPKQIQELEQPHNVEAKPVELVSEPSVPMKPAKKPKPKPVTPELPKSTLKPRKAQTGVTEGIPKQSGVKPAPLPVNKPQNKVKGGAGGIKSSTIGGEK